LIPDLWKKKLMERLEDEMDRLIFESLLPKKIMSSKKNLPKVIIEKGKYKAYDEPQIDQPLFPNSSFSSFTSFVPTSSAIGWATTHSRGLPPSSFNDPPSYKPSPDEILKLSAERAEELKKKGKTQDEIEIILKDYVEDLI